MLLKPVLPVLDYIINYDYIATTLCENKAKPEMHCNGKCHLAKELAKAAENEKPLSEKKSGHIETEVLFFEAIATFQLSPQFNVSKTANSTEYRNGYSHLDAAFVFRPPVFI
ncbi:hypothetical protein HYN59_08640 [Flavobacterium album]|uniref:Uncharacterized protein n=2 Tax=Flavobacterium album TaxID=2175091 RepID=A0A2S1R2L5_9FLAO|nr:hypothetical protein HYN59_08640 [Flavobacterium album]